jgi:hypothetical protein
MHFEIERHRADSASGKRYAGASKINAGSYLSGALRSATVELPATSEDAWSQWQDRGLSEDLSFCSPHAGRDFSIVQG